MVMVLRPSMLTRAIARWLLDRLGSPRRPPDLVIGDCQLLRWHLVRRNRWLNVYLHYVRASDDDEALHDHPWWSLSLCLDGYMWDVSPGDNSNLVARGCVVIRSARAAHRLEVPDWWRSGCWTLFVTGPVIREWGFHCPRGWRHWRDFVDARDRGQRGRGCGED